MAQAGSVVGAWRKSSRCETQACVEVASSHGLVAVRNSSEPHQQIAFARPVWQTFIAGLQAGDFGCR